MQFQLTFNKPAAQMFFGENPTGSVKIKVEDGKVLFKNAKKESGNGIFPLSARTRGGVGITLSGRFAENFLKQTGMASDTHMKLEAQPYHWIAGEAVEGKPSKIVPTARLWKAKDEKIVKAGRAKRAK